MVVAPPLDHQVAIVDRAGRPTPEFIRWWENQRISIGALDAGQAAFVRQVDKASTLEAQAGVNDTKWMTPARVADVALGMGQTWVDVTASRAVNTTYQNTTGRTIVVTMFGPPDSGFGDFQVSPTGSGSWLTLGSIGGQGGDWGGRNTGTFIIPDKLYYRKNSGSFTTWSELR